MKRYKRLFDSSIKPVERIQPILNKKKKDADTPDKKKKRTDASGKSFDDYVDDAMKEDIDLLENLDIPNNFKFVKNLKFNKDENKLVYHLTNKKYVKSILQLGLVAGHSRGFYKKSLSHNDVWFWNSNDIDAILKEVNRVNDLTEAIILISLEDLSATFDSWGSTGYIKDNIPLENIYGIATLKYQLEEDKIERYTRFFEKRSNPDKNVFVGAWDYLDKYKDDPDVYITFTRIDKVGINPTSKFNTPNGIYAYPIGEYCDAYIFPNLELSGKDAIRNTEKRYKHGVGWYAPFAGGSKYVSFLRVDRSAGRFIDDMYTDYGSDDFDRDVDKLKTLYNKQSTPKISKVEVEKLSNRILTSIIEEGNFVNAETVRGVFTTNLQDFGSDEDTSVSMKHSIWLAFMSEWKKHQYDDLILIEEEMRKFLSECIFKKLNNSESEIDLLIYNAVMDAKSKNPVMSLWNTTRILAQKFTGKESSPNRWNIILNRDLGYIGFADKSGKGYIHPSEPMQAVFFSTRSFKVITRVENTPAKGKSNFSPERLKIATMLKKHLNLKHIDVIYAAIVVMGDEGIFYNDPVNGLFINGVQVKSIPIKFINVTGDMIVDNTSITSFANFPNRVYGDFNIFKNPKITSLRGMPKYITGDFYIDKDFADKFNYTDDSIQKLSKIDGRIIYI